MTQYQLNVCTIDGEMLPPPEEQQAMFDAVDAVNAELQSAGVWVFAGGLAPPTTSTVVRTLDGEIIMTDGPFAEGKEHVGGFWILELSDLDAALAWAAKCTVACRRPVEVRPLVEAPEAY